MLIQHNPNEGLKQPLPDAQVGGVGVLIQHNPNEGLKPQIPRRRRQTVQRAHSAQPERGIETTVKMAENDN